ncbi:MAG: hypothetical protein IJD79_07460 [Clostridia bacterium]|nr:hypothetical protein [Clostridia bacterium]
MKKLTSLLLIITLLVLSLFIFSGCKNSNSTDKEEKIPVRTEIELNEYNYWKYINVTTDIGSVFAGGKGSISYNINGVLDFALYEDVVFIFDVIYYRDGQTEEEYQGYTMSIACNAAGDAAFETTYLGITNVTVGKWLGTSGNLVSFENYNWKIHFKSVSGKVIYTA